MLSCAKLRRAKLKVREVKYSTASLIPAARASRTARAHALIHHLTTILRTLAALVHLTK